MVLKRRMKVHAGQQRGRAPFWLQDKGKQLGPLLEERATMIFQPDILIDAQFQASHRRRFHLEPERVLMLAVLQDAVGCFQAHLGARCKRKQAMHSDAEAWICSTDRSHLFSFENVCEALGFDPAYMREGLTRWKRTARQSRVEKGLQASVGRVGN